jgi:hypothetical protein
MVIVVKLERERLASSELVDDDDLQMRQRPAATCCSTSRPPVPPRMALVGKVRGSRLVRKD